MFQQDEVLAELREYAYSADCSSDCESVKLAITYLEALNKLFEKSILGQRVRVFDVNGTTIQRMREGFKFFADWAEESHKGDDKQLFLAWQVCL